MTTKPVYPHPLLDARGPGIVITRSAAPRVFAGAGRADFLITAQRRKRRPVLVTGADAVLSEAMVRLLRETGGAWGVHGGGEAWDGFTGRRLPVPEAAVRRAATGPEDLHPAFLETDAAPQCMRVRITLSRRHRDAFETVLGGDVESLAEELTGARPAGWGMHEPCGVAWDKEELTAHARGSGGPARYLVAGPRAARELSGQLAVHRTRLGVEELSDLVVSAGDEDDADTTLRLSAVPRVLESLSSGVPLFAIAFAEPGRADLLRGPRLPRPFWPLCVLVGAPAIRALDIDVDEVAARHEGTVLGKRRVPALLLDLSAVDPVTAWARLRSFADDLGEDRVNAASSVLARTLFGQGPR